MFKKIINKQDYIINPTLSTSDIKDIKVNLFGKEYFMHQDEWMHNVHLKITDVCNAKCWFCIEKDSNIKENKAVFLSNMISLLDQMLAQNVLSAVTITGGEPTLCPYLQDILDILSHYDIFLTMNTNGRCIPDLKNPPQWINISKHNFNDSHITGLSNVTRDDLSKIKSKLKTNIRLQSVLQAGELDSVDKILLFIDCYKDAVDDFSFRQLISNLNITNQPLLVPFREYLLKYGSLVEQVFQDYYVYEVWYLQGIKITLSFSDMVMLTSSEKTEDIRILREIIIHPDGLISGDWSRTTKIIKGV